MREHLKNLRKALLGLPATGETGFEGLLSATLTEITGVPFRLAGSGSQFGVDGKAAYAADAVCFEAIREDSGSIAALTRFALTLIAGKPAAPFATALARWSFATALNPDIGAPHKEFRHLITFNRIDWSEAREAILSTCRIYEDIDVSDTGQWALVELLMATGDPDDASRAKVMIDKLTADRPSYRWSLVEDYCATDPCDPKASKPENIGKTAVSYSAIDVSRLRLHMGSTSEDHFFEMARPGIARFEPQVGIEKHWELISHLLDRKGLPLRQSLFENRKHSALVTREHAERLVERLKAGIDRDDANPMSEKEWWIVAQYHLLLAFPLLSANEQIAALLSEHSGEYILVELLESAKALDDSRFDALFIHNIGLLLAFALADSNPDQAVQLITRLTGGEPLVRWTFGPAGIPLEAITIWSVKDHPTIEDLRFDRLDRAGNDADLSLEVMAALWNGKHQQLRSGPALCSRDRPCRARFQCRSSRRAAPGAAASSRHHHRPHRHRCAPAGDRSLYRLSDHQVRATAGASRFRAPRRASTSRVGRVQPRSCRVAHTCRAHEDARAPHRSAFDASRRDPSRAPTVNGRVPPRLSGRAHEKPPHE